MIGPHSDIGLESPSDPFVAYYEKQSASPATIAHFRRIRDMLLSVLPSMQGHVNVLDIGCGAGSFCQVWAESGFAVAGIDINPELITLAQNRMKAAGFAAEFRSGSATALPWPDASFAIITMPELLEHIEDWQSCLAEAIRVLAPGGALYLSTTNVLCPVQSEFDLPLYSWYPKSLKRRCVSLATSTHPQWVQHARFPAVNWFSPRKLSALLSQQNLEVFDRFGIWAQYSQNRRKRMVGRIIGAIPILNLLGQIATPSTILVARKPSA